jgi:hypothetical protein
MPSSCDASNLESETGHSKILSNLLCVPTKYCAIIPSHTLSVTQLLVFNLTANLKTNLLTIALMNLAIYWLPTRQKVMSKSSQLLQLRDVHG